MSGPAYDPNYPTPPKSSNSWIWITLLVLLAVLLVCAGVCGGCFWLAGKATTEGVQGALQSIELFGLQAAAAPALHSSPEISDKIGPITGFDPPKLVGTYGAEQPTVACSFVINGEKGSATAVVTGTRESGALRPTDIEVKFGDGTSVNVPPGEFKPDLNFEIGPELEPPSRESVPPAAGDSGDIETPEEAPASDSTEAN